MKEREIYKRVLTTIEKLSKLDFSEIEISDYNEKYLREYYNNSSFYASLYAQLLYKAVGKLNKSVEESVFVDYGGGCGVLSYTAKELGFKTVIYNDIYDVSVQDTKEVATAISCQLDLFICGDIDEVLLQLKKHQVHPDVICSFDVLEHIYNLEEWFAKLKAIETPFSLCFMTSANGTNPHVRKRLQKIHHQAEFVGKEKSFGWKERDAYLPFLEIRKKMISEFDHSLEASVIDLLAAKTRGLKKEDIISFVKEYKENQQISRKLPYLTNTCDPYTGNWAEHVINLKALKKMLKDEETQVRFTNGKYGYTSNKILTLVKFMLNIVMRVLGKENLYFSHTYTLELDVKRS